MTLSDFEQPNDRHYALFQTERELSDSTVSNSLKLGPSYQRQKCITGILVFDNIGLLFMGHDAHYLCGC